MKAKTGKDKLVHDEKMSMEEVIKKVAKIEREKKKTKVEKGEFIPEGQLQQVLFKKKEIRQIFHKGEWYFSVIDAVDAIVETDNPRRYWSDLKRQLAEKEGYSELYDNIVQLKMPAPDGKMRETDAVNVETLLRVIQSIPSPKAEPFKRWLAKVGYERIQETQNPEISVKRAILEWQIQGRTGDWIESRLRAIVSRKDLTDEWQKRGIEKGRDYGYLTNVVHKGTFGLKTDEHKELKGLTSQQLRDHMTDLELIFTMLGEKSTVAIAQAMDADGLRQNITAAQNGGKVAGDARKELEKKIQKSVVSASNFLSGSKSEKAPKKLTAKKKKLVE